MKIGLALVALSVAGLSGCGASPSTSCALVPVLSVTPATATVSSSAKAPGNEVQFQSYVFFTANHDNCPVPEIAFAAFPTWTNPDTLHISISSAADATNGTAVCKGPTAGAVTLTANTTYGTAPVQPLSATVQLTCN